MDDSTLIFSMKQGIEYMLSITEEFYYINNTSANYKKYVLATNAISTVQDLAAITFDLTTSLLNNVRLITVTPIPMSSSFQFLDYIASTIASLVITSFRLLRAGSASMPDMTYSYGHTPIYQCFTPEKLGNARISKWYKDLSANVTSPNCPDLLLDQYMTTLPFSLAAKELTLCTPLVGHKKNWIVTLDADDHLLFSKQLQFQPTSIMKYTTQIASTVLWAEIMDSVTSYFYCFNIFPDYSTTNPSALPLMTDLDSSATSLFTADDIVASTPPPYAFICGCLPTAFIETFTDLDVPCLAALNVIAAIHNNFINKFRKRIWNPRSYDKGLWEHAMNITSKLKNSSRPKELIG
uniref:Uncharacterized protein n=1 Tax=Rhizophagus irregularis (strain DAOM 181602 / DAOM 197198 / MUCL 43194) TaxID=747089 RepID=U9V505_RHIID